MRISGVATGHFLDHSTHSPGDDAFVWLIVRADPLDQPAPSPKADAAQRESKSERTRLMTVQVRRKIIRRMRSLRSPRGQRARGCVLRAMVTSEAQDGSRGQQDARGRLPRGPDSEPACQKHQRCGRGGSAIAQVGLGWRSAEYAAITAHRIRINVLLQIIRNVFRNLYSLGCSLECKMYVEIRPRYTSPQTLSWSG